MLNKFFKLQITFLGHFQKWSTEFMAFSWKIAQSSTWIVEDVAFHSFLSALVSIYSDNFLTLLQIILKKIQDSRRLLWIWSAHLTEFCTVGERDLTDLQDTVDNKLNSEGTKLSIWSCSRSGHFMLICFFCMLKETPETWLQS